MQFAGRGLVTSHIEHRLSCRLPITDFAHKATVIGNAPVSAVLAGLDVAAKRCRAAVLDRRHDLELGEAQVAGLGHTISCSFSAEDVSDLERGAQAASAARILALHQRCQMLERTGHRADRLGRDACIERGRIEFAVPQQPRAIMRTIYVIETQRVAGRHPLLADGAMPSAPDTRQSPPP